MVKPMINFSLVGIICEDLVSNDWITFSTTDQQIYYDNNNCELSCFNVMKRLKDNNLFPTLLMYKKEEEKSYIDGFIKHFEEHPNKMNPAKDSCFENAPKPEINAPKPEVKAPKPEENNELPMNDNNMKNDEEEEKDNRKHCISERQDSNEIIDKNYMKKGLLDLSNQNKKKPKQNKNVQGNACCCLCNK